MGQPVTRGFYIKGHSWKQKHETGRVPCDLSLFLGLAEFSEVIMEPAQEESPAYSLVLPIYITYKPVYLKAFRSGRFLLSGFLASENYPKSTEWLKGYEHNCLHTMLSVCRPHKAALGLSEL